MPFQKKFDSVGYLAETGWDGPRRGGYKNRKLTKEEVKLIRRENDSGVPQLTLAIRFNISQSAISKIIRRLRYTWID